MDPTPIKIRGKKRKYTIAHTKALATALATSQPTGLSTDRTKRPKKPSFRKPTAVPAMPTIQGLPQELLEIIFLYSMNIALPRCAPTLGRKLSSRAVIMDFTMQSLFYTVDHKTNYQYRKRTSDPLLQSEVISCRFFTYEFFLAYVQHAHEIMIKLRGRAWKETGVQVLGVEAFEGLWPYKFTQIPYLGFAEGFRIPEKLLHGPWTDAKASLLYVLVSLNGEIDWVDSLSGEAAKTGIKEAIDEGNERAVAALSVLLGVSEAITTEMLRYAVVQCDCPLNLMRHLLFNAQILSHDKSKEVVDFFDSKLWAWADANGEKGSMLKEMLKKADAFDLEFYFENAEWTEIVSFPYGGSKFDVRTSFDNIVRELLEKLYRNYGRRITRNTRHRPFQDRPSDES